MLAATDPTIDWEDAIISVPEGKKETKNFGRELVRDLSTRGSEYEQHMMPTERLLDDSPMWLLGYIGHWEGRENDHPEGGAVRFYEHFNELVRSQFSVQLTCDQLE